MTPDEPDITAAELALGVLDGEERAAALRRVLAEPAFAREVEQWRERLAGLYAEWPEAEPSADAARRAAAIPDGERRQVSRWRWAAAVSGIAAALLLAIVALRPTPAPVARTPIVQPSPQLVAVLKPEEGRPFGVVLDPKTREVRLHGTVAVPAQRVAELWVIGDDGVPHAAGLLPRDAAAPLMLAAAVPVTPGMTLAISIEPPGGSPKPTPTGPVVATGTLAAI